MVAADGSWAGRRALPAPGPVAAPCGACRLPGELAVEHRYEWADPPPGGWPPGVAAARLALACRGCGSDFLSVGTQLAATPEAPLAVVPWLTCEQCGHGAAAVTWAWLACGRCRAEVRAEVGGVTG